MKFEAYFLYMMLCLPDDLIAEIMKHGPNYALSCTCKRFSYILNTRFNKWKAVYTRALKQLPTVTYFQKSRKNPKQLKIIEFHNETRIIGYKSHTNIFYVEKRKKNMKIIIQNQWGRIPWVFERTESSYINSKISSINLIRVLQSFYWGW